MSLLCQASVTSLTLLLAFPRQPDVRIRRCGAAGGAGQQVVRAPAFVQTCPLLSVDSVCHHGVTYVLLSKGSRGSRAIGAADGAGPPHYPAGPPRGASWGPPPWSTHSFKVMRVPCRCPPHPPSIVGQPEGPPLRNSSPSPKSSSGATSPLHHGPHTACPMAVSPPPPASAAAAETPPGVWSAAFGPLCSWLSGLKKRERGGLWWECSTSG